MAWLAFVSHLVQIGKRTQGLHRCHVSFQRSLNGEIDFHFSDFLDGYHSTAQLAVAVTQQFPPGSGCRMSYPVIGTPGFVHSRSRLEGGTLDLLVLCCQRQDWKVSQVSQTVESWYLPASRPHAVWVMDAPEGRAFFALVCFS